MFEQMNLEQVVDEVLATLTERERTVLEMRYGYRGEPVTQKDLGAEFGVSGSRIGQIEEAALRKLRYPLDRIKILESYLSQALSRGKDDFYARLFIKLFKLNQDLIHNIIEAGPPIVETEISQEPPPKEVSPSSSIEGLELSIHSFNCLMRAGVHTVQDLMNLSDEKLCKIRNLGAKTTAEIREKRSALTLEFFKQKVRKCLMHGLTSEERKAYVEKRMKLYEDEFPQFLKDGWTPGGVAAALIMGY